MMRVRLWLPVCALLAAWINSSLAQDDVADVPSIERRAGDDEHKRYFLIGAPAEAPPPETKRGLVIVLPGGDGSAEFHPFVKRIYKYALPEGYLIAQPVAVRWTPKQQVVWPTQKLKAPQMKFGTEEFVSAVIDDVSAQHAIDPSRIFTLSWSSGGPAAYALSLTEKRITGSLVAMSVFKPNLLPDLKAASGRAYWIYHSPDDRVCPFRMAEQAEKELKAKGANVKLATYSGGHGWRGNLYDDIRDGIGWLAENPQSASER